MSKIVFGYWGIRGKGQETRLLLDYCGLEWEDKQYVDQEDWFEKDKAALGFDFPNLPYLIDGDFKLTESSAVTNYIIRKSEKLELLGKNMKDQAVVENVSGVLQEAGNHMVPLFWNPKYEELKGAAWDKVKPKLDLIAKFVGERDFVIGYLTLLDFRISEISHYLETMFPEQFKEYPFLTKIRNSIDNLPEVKKYYEKPTAMKAPFTGPTAALQF